MRTQISKQQREHIENLVYYFNNLDITMDRSDLKKVLSRCMTATEFKAFAQTYVNRFILGENPEDPQKIYTPASRQIKNNFYQVLLYACQIAPEYLGEIYQTNQEMGTNSETALLYDFLKLNYSPQTLERVSEEDRKMIFHKFLQYAPYSLVIYFERFPQEINDENYKLIKEKIQFREKSISAYFELIISQVKYNSDLSEDEKIKISEKLLQHDFKFLENYKNILFTPIDCDIFKRMETITKNKDQATLALSKFFVKGSPQRAQEILDFAKSFTLENGIQYGTLAAFARSNPNLIRKIMPLILNTYQMEQSYDGQKDLPDCIATLYLSAPDKQTRDFVLDQYREIKKEDDAERLEGETIYTFLKLRTAILKQAPNAALKAEPCIINESDFESYPNSYLSTLAEDKNEYNIALIKADLILNNGVPSEKSLRALECLPLTRDYNCLFDHIAKDNHYPENINLKFIELMCNAYKTANRGTAQEKLVNTIADNADIIYQYETDNLIKNSLMLDDQNYISNIERNFWDEYTYGLKIIASEKYHINDKNYCISQALHKEPKFLDDANSLWEKMLLEIDQTASLKKNIHNKRFVHDSFPQKIEELSKIIQEKPEICFTESNKEYIKNYFRVKKFACEYSRKNSQDLFTDETIGSIAQSVALFGNNLTEEDFRNNLTLLLDVFKSINGSMTESPLGRNVNDMTSYSSIAKVISKTNHIKHRNHIDFSKYNEGR